MATEVAVAIFECMPTDARCVKLLSDLDAYLTGLYPPEDNALLSIDQLLQPEVSFVVAEAASELVGCAALVRRGDGYAEIKRMFVEPWARGRGIGERLLRFLEQLGRHDGYALFRLETGVLQPEALKLYERVGYTQRGPFGDYSANASSIFMEKQLPRVG